MCCSPGEIDTLIIYAVTPGTSITLTMALKANAHLHVADGSPDTPASYYYGEDDNHPPVPEDIDDKLRKLGPYSDVASRVTGVITREAAERKHTIGGVDHMWVMLSDVADFNPVSCETLS